MVIAQRAEDGKAIWVLGDLYRIRLSGEQTGGAYALIECNVSAGNGPPPHIHLHEDETFWIVEGDFSFLAGDKTIRFQTGSCVHVPRNTLHTFKNEGSTTGRVLVLVSPPGLEKFFERISEPVTDISSPPPVTQETLQKVLTLAPEYGMEIPPPPQ
jgi:mannose-6-phosphate isomerase-like protein (cupin superfamily)